MKTLSEYIKQNIFEALENHSVENLSVTYKCVKNEVLINCPETYQEDDIHQYIDDLLLEQMPSNQDIAKKYFRNNVKYINDAYFEYDGFQRLGYKKDDVDITYNDDLGKNAPEDIKIVTFKLTNLRFKMMFTKFDLMINDDDDIKETLDKIFTAYESNAYNDTDITFEYDSCEFDQWKKAHIMTFKDLNYYLYIIYQQRY